MNTHAAVQPKQTPASTFRPTPDFLLRRKCACGSSAVASGECEACARKNESLQRKSWNENTVGEVPQLVHEALRSLGHPLDAATRALMEPRFGHDFSQVRIHTDAKAAKSARAVSALAYTVGNELVFGHDQYKPGSGAGRMLIAHELVHTIQQQNGTQDSATGDGALERDADYAASAAMLNRPVKLSSAATPPVQFLKVTSGALGKALEVFTDLWNVPDRAVKLLRKSPSFMKLAAVLENNYVWRLDSVKVDSTGETGPDGRLKEGPYKGKRELFNVIRDKPSFEPSETPPEPGKIKVSGDVISLKSRDVPGFIAEIAHEATHAARFVGVTTPPPATIVDEVEAGIRDEVETRKSEMKILGEIPAPDVQARVAHVGTRVPLEVERDISPALGLTYLENFFFASRLREARAKDGISDEDAENIRYEVEKDFQGKTLPRHKLHFKPQPGPSGLYELSDYGDIWFNRRLAQAEWEKFQGNNRPADPDYAVEKEKLVQDHAKRFFEGRVSYRALPEPLATP